MGPQENAGFIFRGLLPFAFATSLGAGHIGFDVCSLLSGCEFFQQRMFRRDDHVGRSVQRVRTRRVYPQYVVAGVTGESVFLPRCLPGCEFRITADKVIDLRSHAPTDPVLLELFDSVRPI